jgi:hypothetical protein
MAASFGALTIPSFPRLRSFQMRTTNGPANATDVARAITVANPDTIYAGGFITEDVFYDTTPPREIHIWRVQKRLWNGTVVWNSSPTIPGEILYGEINAVAATPDGGVVATGVGRDFLQGTPELQVIKWDANGTFLWKRLIKGRTAAGQDRLGDGEGVSLAVTSNGNVAVTGRIRNEVLNGAVPPQPHDDNDIVVAMLNGSTGAEQWRRLVKGSQFAASDEPNGLAIDLNDNVVAVGGVRNIGMDKDIAIASFTPTGVSRFPQISVWGTANGDDVATNVATDAQGQIYVTGYRISSANGVPNKDLWVGKFAGNGTSLFQRDLQGTVPGGEDRGLAVGCDAVGNLYATGFTTNTGSSGSPTPPAASTDLTVSKWDALTGNLVWTRKLDGGANGDDRARSLAVLASGELVVGGHLTMPGTATNPGTAKDFVMIRFSTIGTQGFTFRHSGSLKQDDQCTSVAFDATGWAVGAGVVRNGPPPLIGGPVTNADFAVAM